MISSPGHGDANGVKTGAERRPVAGRPPVAGLVLEGPLVADPPPVAGRHPVAGRVLALVRSNAPWHVAVAATLGTAERLLSIAAA